LESEKVTLGQIVHSKAGRDKGEFFIVVGMSGDEYVLISDGDIRKIENPKKKKVKHLVFHDMMARDIKAKIEANIKINNSYIRNAIKALILVKE
jgi:large subunit ribosomal protein L14e